MCTGDICLGLIAIIFPPIAVWVKRGLCSVDSLINLALCCLGFIPGLIHAWYIIASTPDQYEIVMSDPEAGIPRRESRTTYYYVSQPGPQAQPKPQIDGYGSIQQPNYGTTGGPSNQSAGDAEVPPTYHEAVRGDNKVQR